MEYISYNVISVFTYQRSIVRLCYTVHRPLVLYCPSLLFIVEKPGPMRAKQYAFNRKCISVSSRVLSYRCFVIHPVHYPTREARPIKAGSHNLHYHLLQVKQLVHISYVLPLSPPGDSAR